MRLHFKYNQNHFKTAWCVYLCEKCWRQRMMYSTRIIRICCLWFQAQPAFSLYLSMLWRTDTIKLQIKNIKNDFRMVAAMCYHSTSEESNWSWIERTQNQTNWEDNRHWYQWTYLYCWYEREKIGLRYKPKKQMEPENGGQQKREI